MEDFRTTVEAVESAAVDAEYATGEREATEAEARRSIVRRVTRVTVGGVVLTGGVAMLVLPGPGILVAGAGLAIMARDVPWAARTLERVRERQQQIVASAKQRRRGR